MQKTVKGGIVGLTSPPRSAYDGALAQHERGQ